MPSLPTNETLPAERKVQFRLWHFFALILMLTVVLAAGAQVHPLLSLVVLLHFLGFSVILGWPKGWLGR